MGKVVLLRKSAPRSEVVAFYKRLLARAEAGQITGSVHVLAVNDGPDEIGLCGELADDPGYAVSACQEGFDAIAGYKICFEKDQLPLRLRKGYQSEQVQVLPLSVRCQ